MHKADPKNGFPTLVCSREERRQIMAVCNDHFNKVNLPFVVLFT